MYFKAIETGRKLPSTNSEGKIIWVRAGILHDKAQKDRASRRRIDQISKRKQGFRTVTAKIRARKENRAV